jgi:hypothetical protein
VAVVLQADAVSRTASDLLTARALAIGYSDMATSIEAEATEPRFRNMPLTVRRMRSYAAIARRAGVAERDDPEIDDDRKCSICGRVRSCLAVR